MSPRRTRKKKPQISPLRYALSKNISRKGRQHRDLSTALRFGRDDKVRATLPWESGLGQKAFFITLGGPQAHDFSGRDDKVVTKLEKILHGKNAICIATTLSSRPERSAVERSAVSFCWSHADSLGPPDECRSALPCCLGTSFHRAHLHCRSSACALFSPASAPSATSIH